MSEISEKIDLEYAIMHYEKPIVYISFKENAEVGFPEIREMIFHAERLSNRKPYLVFTDARTSPNITQEGRRVALEIKEAPYNHGCAVWVNSDMFKLAVNFFMGFKKPVYPYRAFTDKQKAIEWLLQLPLEE